MYTHVIACEHNCACTNTDMYESKYKCAHIYIYACLSHMCTERERERTREK